MQEAMNEVLNVNPRLKMKVHVGAIKIHVWGKHREFSREITMEVSEKLIEGVAKEGWMLSLNAGEREGKSGMIAFCSCLAKRLEEYS